MKFATQLCILIFICLAIIAFMLIIASYILEFKEELRISKEKRKNNANNLYTKSLKNSSKGVSNE